MRNRKFSSRAVFLVLSLLVSGCLSHSGNMKEQWETKNGKFKIRVTSYEEKGLLLTIPGMFFVFESTSVGSENWHEVMRFRDDDPGRIPLEQVRFVSDQVGYVFMGWMYAATTNGGLSWFVWDAEKDSPFKECCGYGFIKDVQVAPNGTGTMTIKPTPQGQRDVRELHTKDYGQHWNIEQ